MSPAVRQSYAVAAICFLLCCVYHPGTPRNTKAQAASTVQLDIFCIQENPMSGSGSVSAVTWETWSGSGVIIDRKRILTAYHVTQCDYVIGIRAVLSTGEKVEMAPDRAFREDDLAVIQVVDKSAEPFHVDFPMISAIPKIGSMVCATTAKPSRGWSCGLIKSTESLGHKVEVTSDIVHGNSGGPVWDVGGRLVGVITDTCVCPDRKTYGCAGQFRSIDHLKL